MQIWLIDRLVPGGAGMARLADGRVGFAAGALPGDRIAVHELRERGSYCEAERFQLVTASTERVSPPCPVARECGGCDWMELELSAQRRHKLELLTQALERTAGLRELPALAIEHAGSDLGYRNRLRFQIDERGELGFFARGSRRLVVITRCAVAEPELDRALELLRAVCAEHRTALSAFVSAELRVAASEPRYGLRLEARERARPDAAQLRALLSQLSRHFAVALGSSEAAEQRYELPLGVELSVPVGGFTQVNWAVNARLVGALVERALALGVTTFCDLYAGAGNFTLPLLRAGLRGVAVEGYAPALAAASRSASRQALAGEFLAEDVARAVRKLARAERRFELVLLDPPRAGARAALASLAAISERHLAYVACDPVTLARDLKWLLGHGFTLRSITAFDMFPHTHHFETVAWLERV